MRIKYYVIINKKASRLREAFFVFKRLLILTKKAALLRTAFVYRINYLLQFSASYNFQTILRCMWFF